MSAQPRNGHDNVLANHAVAAGEAGRQLCEPAARAMAQSSGELICLLSRRAQAYMELPARLGACSTPQDVLAEQARFAQTAWTHYAECCVRVASACQALAPQSAEVAQLWQSAMREPFGDASDPGRDRDYLIDTDGEPASSERRSGQPRHAA